MTESLHVLFTLFSEFKNNQHFAAERRGMGGADGPALALAPPLSRGGMSSAGSAGSAGLGLAAVGAGGAMGFAGPHK